MDNNALIVAEKLDVTVVFSDKGMAKLLDEIKTKVIAHVSDTSSEQGRKDIISLAYKITRSKTLIDDLGKGVVAEWKKKAKLIDEHRKTARDFLDDLKNTARQPLTDWEAEQAIIKEKEVAAAKEKIQARLGALFAVNVILPFQDVALMSDADYEDKLILATDAFKTEQLRVAEEQAIKEKESKRLEQLAKEQAIEAARLAKINEEQEAIAKTQKAKEDALKAQEVAIETAKRKEIERQEQIAWQTRETERLCILAEAAAAEKIEKEKKEEEERIAVENAEKRRLLELAPDKDKLIVFANQLQDLTVKDLSLKSKKAQALYNTTQESLAVVIAGLRTKIGKL